MMKKRVLSGLLAASLLASTAHAGIPVTVVADVPSQMNQVQNYAQMLKEYATLIDQLEQMKQQFTQMGFYAGIPDFSVTPVSARQPTHPGQ